ncbi:unnamed protein product [Colletotrichum noveboracense]|uniref:COPI associated protein n=1 Tax=Colletotrichum noveboracense TaxID=2664923 RepID=A0A9W4W6E6_9PEZI|nr:unnamed protein product [Colletotrichum noveboracense]
MELSDAFRIVNLVTATVMVLGGIAQFFDFSLYVSWPSADPVGHLMCLRIAAAKLSRSARARLRASKNSVDKGTQSIQGIIVGAYVIIFGLSPRSPPNPVAEFQIPPQVSRYASFLFSFIGRGIFYIFIGSILINNGIFKILAGSIIGIIGVAYAALEFVPQIEPPANMREADGGWGAEQV